MPNSDAIQTVKDLSNGNPGAAVALGQVFRELGESQFSTLIYHLGRLGFTGTEIYLCWNDFAGRDLYKFFEGVRTEDPEMVSIVQRETRR